MALQGRPLSVDENSMCFHTVLLFKDQTLGIGSYGAVCKAKCDDLLCAAKILHPTLFDPTAHHRITPHRESRLPYRRFQQEFELMTTIRHPNIVQYLGTHQDPDTHLPVLLMELMDDSLTNFLETSQEPLSYHTQLNFCHDISCALSFLHSNALMHRDLSSNNVLLLGDIRAKVSDFGMAKLPQATVISRTICPGTDAYMPPEALKEKPIYSVRIDCFSFGVLVLQILTRQFPRPADRHRTVQIDHPQFPNGTIQVVVPENERRQNHISQVDPNQPLLAIALDCLKDEEAQRPSAQELCARISDMKKTAQYDESVRIAQERVTAQNDREAAEEEWQHREQLLLNEIASKEKENERLKEQHSQEIKKLGATIGILSNRLQEIEGKDKTITANQQKDLNQQVKNKQAKFNDSLTYKETQSSNIYESTATPVQKPVQFNWREAKAAPCETYRTTNAVVDDNMVYLRKAGTQNMYAYNSTEDTWSQLPDSLTESCSLALVNNLLTTIGGKTCGSLTNQLFSLIGEDSQKKWKDELLPPMPTKRSSVAAICIGKVLVVAGGYGIGNVNAVEVLNIDTGRWSSATGLPEPLEQASMTICGDHIYMLGGRRVLTLPSSGYKCSLMALLDSCEASSKEPCLTSDEPSPLIWGDVADLPVTLSTCVTLNDQLLAIGGMDSDFNPTTAIYMYNPSTDTWKVIDQMNNARSFCLAAVLPNNNLFIVGGRTTKYFNSKTNNVEIATLV